MDVLDGLPDIIVLLQARNRQELTELTNWALVSVETMTEGCNYCQSRMDAIRISVQSSAKPGALTARIV